METDWVAGWLGIGLGLACVPRLPLSLSSRVALAVVYVPAVASLLFLYWFALFFREC
jgi:hypothetical protein